MIDWNEIGIIPLTDAGGITKYFNSETHKGLDIGWYKNENCPVLAWQDGTLIAKGYSGQCGYWLVMEHTYSTGKRWVGYIHLYNAVSAEIGKTFKMGEKIGNARRGNTGYSNGTHLHIYMTKVLPMNEKFVWTDKVNKLSDYAIDPLPHLYYDKAYNTEYISLIWSRALPEKITYPKPVERDIEKHQIEVKSNTRRLREAPSLSAKIYDDNCKKGIYDVHETKNADGYDWVLIDTINDYPFWVASMKGEDLPVQDYKELYEKEKEKNKTLADEVNKLEVENIKLEEEYATISKDHMTLTGKLKRIKEIVEE